MMREVKFKTSESQHAGVEFVVFSGVGTLQVSQGASIWRAAAYTDGYKPSPDDVAALKVLHEKSGRA
jgi:hypothetical protein